MKKFIPILLVVLFILRIPSAYPQKAWTLEDCITYALDHNIDIKKQMLTVQSNKSQLLQSKISLLPDLNANATNVWNFGQTIDQYTNTFANTTVRSNNFYISTGLTLFGGFTKINAMTQNQLNLLASNYDLDVMKNNISLAIAGFYLDILFNLELLDVARNQVSITKDQVSRIEKMVAAGSSAKGDLLNIQAQESGEEYLVVDAENKLSIAKISLQQLIDLPVTKDFTVDKPVLKAVEKPSEVLTPDQIFGYAVQSRPEIKGADLRVQSAMKSLAISRGKLSPVLSVGASWGTGYSGASKEIDPNIPGDTVLIPIGYTETGKETVLAPERQYSYRVKSFSDQLVDNNNKSVGIYLNVPIFNGWTGRTAISLSKIQADQAALELEAKKRDLRKSIEQAYADAVASLNKFNSSTQKLAAQKESFNYTQQKFDVGMLTSFDFNNAKKDLTKAESDLLQAKYDFIFKTTILDFYMGKPISIN